MNYGLLRGFVDVMGFLMFYLIIQTTIAFVDTNLNPDMVLANIYPDGVPLSRWLPGFIFPVISLGFCVFTVIYIFIPHKKPKGYIIIDDSNAQKYYDTIMMANSLIRIIVLLGLWDYTYIHHSNIMFGSESWISFQAIMDIIVCIMIIMITRHKIKEFTNSDYDNAEKEETSENIKIMRR